LACRSSAAIALIVLTTATPAACTDAAPGERPGSSRDQADRSAPGTTRPSSSAPTQSSNELAYVFPLEPASAADYGPGHHDYPATDIFAPEGTRFVAVTNGEVDFVSRVDRWEPNEDDPATRGGLSVAIVGDDGVRYYGSHLSEVAPRIAPGDEVEAGSLLGRVGQSGNAASTSPHLHFGVSRPTRPDDWRTRRGEVDTYPLLREWERGHDVTPTLPS
jgi:murein DD-endopeptidase MepM/ murein hydrolase activator NlpD